jgi:hypothetical protein
MSATRFRTLTIHALSAGVLVATFASVMSAQKSKPAGPPVTTHGETKANAAAVKGQANAEAKRTDAAEDKAARTADKTEDSAERAAAKAARRDPSEGLKGIKLSKSEKQSVDAIKDRYAKQVKALEKQEDAAEKSGRPDASIAAKIAALRTQERADLRAALDPAQAKQFDQNAASNSSKK